MTLTREALSGPEARVLREGRGFKSDLICVGRGSSAQVVKDFAGRGPVGRRFGRWLIGRELRAYERLRDHPSVPQVHGRVDDYAFAVEYRPGEVMGPGLAGRVPPDFITDLRAAVREMHVRGVVHLDLRHRSNVLAAPDGRPVLIDFASALCFRRGGLGGLLLMPLFSWIDRRAVDKWQHQIEGAPAAYS